MVIPFTLQNMHLLWSSKWYHIILCKEFKSLEVLEHKFNSNLFYNAEQLHLTELIFSSNCGASSARSIHLSRPSVASTTSSPRSHLLPRYSAIRHPARTPTTSASFLDTKVKNGEIYHVKFSSKADLVTCTWSWASSPRRPAARGSSRCCRSPSPRGRRRWRGSPAGSCRRWRGQGWRGAGR